MATEQNTLYKLMVLYMLEKIDFSMTFSQISDFILGQGYTDYFSLLETLSELEQSNLVHVETVQNSTYYSITPEGEKTIGYFSNRVSKPIRNDINNYLHDHRLELRNETSVQADYFRNTEGEYSAHCVVKEKNNTLIDLTLSVPTEEQAKAICRQWSKSSQPVYEYLMKTLMK